MHKCICAYIYIFIYIDAQRNEGLLLLTNVDHNAMQTFPLTLLAEFEKKNCAPHTTPSCCLLALDFAWPPLLQGMRHPFPM